MIVRIMSSGKSFKGVATYLTHDPKSKTTERLGWTHTLNLANDHVPSAVDEMIATAQNAELLKQEAGIRAGGRQTEDKVKHLSINWAPEERPTKDHMIETSEAFLQHMGWQDHQTLIVNHTDKAHAHVHLAVNVIHPETGLRLNDDFEQRRAQEWALDYERENGRIHCEQRLKNVEEREDAPTRPAWLAFQNKQQDFERHEKSLQKNEPISGIDEKNEKILDYSEFKKLKEIQRDERKSFFAEGKLEFKELRNSIYREVRDEFRDRWSFYYGAERDGEDHQVLAALKAELVVDQGEVLKARRDEACKELRETRNERYRDLLDDQYDIRSGLRSRQEAGLDNELFLRQVENGQHKDITADFRTQADLLTVPARSNAMTEDAETYASRPGREATGVKSGINIGTGIGEGVGFGLISFMESIADGFMGATPNAKPHQPVPEARDANPFMSANDNTPKAVEPSRVDDEEDWYQKQRSRNGD